MTTERDTLKEFYQSSGAALTAAPDIDLVFNRALLDQIHRLSAEPKNVTYDEVDAGGRPGMWCIPAGADQGNVILYFHGGGFVVQSVNSHRKLAGHLAAAAGCRVLLLDYRQAPEHQYPSQIEDVEDAYGWLRGQGINPDGIAFAGDSAGACLAVSSVVRLRDKELPLPAAIIGFSPWFDLECNGESLETNAAKDVLVRGPLVQQMVMAYLSADTSRTDPLVNPLHADLAGFPPVFLTASLDEALFDNAQRFADRAREAGVEVELHTVPGQQHVFQFMAGHSSAADLSIAEAGSWVAERLGVVAAVGA
ncbi:alpha/beta hydrolase [Arthrobacter sp. ISL-5]|uniref:alpha/beta hydrolase n=1 Tax=Arthrobacter sp. ISL-5 TaxID=2819111 RepID=UPI001BE8E3ED|nr:alpha/beta hydrolase [Arthrobacter sp. ISL-5]MBT2556015.1 alpha/beta hydrolase [Arthrobacter sp. ISL-5]